jgi:hypothetical protein
MTRDAAHPGHVAHCSTTTNPTAPVLGGLVAEELAAVLENQVDRADARGSQESDGAGALVPRPESWRCLATPSLRPARDVTMREHATREQLRVRHASYGRFFVDSLDDILGARRLVVDNASVSFAERRCARARARRSIALRFERRDRKTSTRTQRRASKTTVLLRECARAQERSDRDVRG